MLTVIGFEGASLREAPTTFGCAAISDGYFVWNSCTRAKCGHEQWSEHVANHNASGCMQSPALPGVALFYPCMVLSAPSGPVAAAIHAHIDEDQAVPGEVGLGANNSTSYAEWLDLLQPEPPGTPVPGRLHRSYGMKTRSSFIQEP